MTPVVQAQEFATTFKATEVVPGITMIEGADGFAGGNMALLAGEDYVALIDDGLAPLAPALKAFVDEAAGRPVNFLVNTHVHGDHVGGNAHFAESGTVVFAHENIRKRLLEDPSGAGGEGGLPVVTFADGVTFYLNGLEAQVFHLPLAHTDGDAAIFFPEVNVLHTGDVFFHGLFPFIDLDNGGTVSGYIAAQQALIERLDDTSKVIPGHGPLATRADLQRDHDMLVDARARVKALVDDGQSADEIVAANPLADYHDDYNWGFISTERMTRTLVRDLGGE
ncbi:MBL fold metallo-hydrolase [Marinihelvus fidelis]|uniref:MBL fold metallo-hydrolase n=2 Tax=Marinihelvus fidelis TaxID=2613842 RepID=A0A5N0TFD4_9GAMM|nr:MBL fold metallo-hydrolase [Marinihelvus fidelis]